MDTATLEVDAEEAGLRELGHETDLAQGRTQTDVPSAEPAESRAPAEAQSEQAEPQPPTTGEPEQPQQPVSSETKSETQQPTRDPETGKFQKPDTEYSRAKNEEIRKGRTWQSIQAEREELRAAQAQFQEQQRINQLESLRQTFSPLKKEGLTAQEYYQGYMRFKQTGDYENAARALETAIEIQNAEQARSGQVQAVNAEYSWRMGMNEAIKNNPDVGNPNSPIPGYIAQIVTRFPELYGMSCGFQLAAEGAAMLAREDLISELQEENLELRAYREKHQRGSQPGKGGYAAPSLTEKDDVDQMSLEEGEAFLRRITAEADNYR